MSQYEHKPGEKPRIKLPLVKENPDSRIRTLEIKTLEIEAENQRLHREVSRLRSEVADIRSIVRNLIR